MKRLLSAALAVVAVTAWSSEAWSRTARHACDVKSWVEERLDNWKQQLARSTPADPSPIAVSFYERRGYRRIPNFGKYAGSLTAVCFEKRLSVSCTGVN